MSETTKLWERIVEARLTREMMSCVQQCGYLLRKSSTDAIFALRALMEKY